MSVLWKNLDSRLMATESRKRVNRRGNGQLCILETLSGHMVLRLMSWSAEGKCEVMWGWIRWQWQSWRENIKKYTDNVKLAHVTGSFMPGSEGKGIKHDHQGEKKRGPVGAVPKQDG